MTYDTLLITPNWLSSGGDNVAVFGAGRPDGGSLSGRIGFLISDVNDLDIYPLNGDDGARSLILDGGCTIQCYTLKDYLGDSIIITNNTSTRILYDLIDLLNTSVKSIKVLTAAVKTGMVNFNTIVLTPAWRSTGGDNIAVLGAGRLTEYASISGRQGFISGPANMLDVYPFNIDGGANSGIVDKGVDLTVFSEKNYRGKAVYYDNRTGSDRLMIDINSDLGTVAKSIKEGYFESYQQPDFNVKYTPDPVCDDVFCRASGANYRAFAGTYPYKDNQKPRVFWTEDGLSWAQAGQLPVSAESINSVVPFNNGEGVHLGTEQSRGRVFDLNRNDFGLNLIIEDESHPYLLQAGGNTENFGQLIISSAKEIPAKAWTYDGGWRVVDLPPIKHPDRDDIAVWCVTEFQDHLLLACSHHSGSSYLAEDAGYIIAYKKGDTQWHLIHNPGFGGTPNTSFVHNGVYYIMYAGRTYWTDDRVTWHPIDGQPGLTCGAMVYVNPRWRLGVFYTGSRVWNQNHYGRYWSAGAWLVALDTKHKIFSTILQLPVGDDRTGGGYPYTIAAELVEGRNREAIGFFNTNDKAYGLRVTW